MESLVMRTITLGTLGLLAAAPLSAQQTPQSDSVYKVPGVEANVTRGLGALGRFPAGISVLTPRELNTPVPTLSPDEVLNLIPGVVAANRNTYALDSRISIRGFGTRAFFGVRGVRIIVDGIPLTMPDGQATLNNLDLGSVGRIEVIRGSASALYGNAAGGVISVESQAAASGRLAAEGRIMMGDYGTSSLNATRKLQAKVGGMSGDVDYFASVSHLDADGPRALSATEQTLFNSRIRYALGDASSLKLIVNAVDMPVAENPGALTWTEFQTTPEIAAPANVARAAGKVAKQAQAGLSFAHIFSGARLDLSVFGVHRETKNPTTFAFIDIDRMAGGFRGTLRTERSLADRPLGLVVGVDQELQRDDRLEYPYAGAQTAPNAADPNFNSPTRDQRDEVDNLGPFVQAELALTERLDLTVGARYDRLHFKSIDHLAATRPTPPRQAPRDDSGDRTLSALSPMLGLTYTLTDAVNVYGSFSTAFQAPTTTELINEPAPPGATFSAGFNGALDPQKAKSFEVGGRGRLGDRVDFDVALYDTELTGELVGYQVDWGQGRTFYRNAGKSRHKGAELGLGWSPAEGVTTRLSYMYADYKFIDDGKRAEDKVLTGTVDGNKLPGVAPHRLFLRADYTHGSGVSLGGDLELSDSYFSDDQNTKTYTTFDGQGENPGYAVVNVRLSYVTNALRQLGIEPFLGVNNVFDELYASSVAVNAAAPVIAGVSRPDQRRFFEPAPRRSLYFGVTVPYGQWGSGR
jgi:iron complex outermembrane recepter protein